MKKPAKELPKVECNCQPKDMSHIGVSNDMKQMYFCAKHNKIRKLPTTKEA